MSVQTTGQELELPGRAFDRRVVAALAALVTLGGVAWGADLYRRLGWYFLTEQLLAAILGIAMAVVYIVRPLRRSDVPKGPAPWYDWILAAASLAAGFYMAWAYPRLLGNFFMPDMDARIVSWTLFVLVIEGLRRCFGWPLVTVVLGFVAFALVGHLIGGSLETREVQLQRMILYLNLDTSGMFGLVLLIGVTVVIPFVLFGQLLGASGGAGFFNDLSLGLMGRYRGGAAKIAVLASSLFGSINGIVVSNIMSTGVITIPLMKRSGYKPEEAAAIEASASNGGQLMPPVMGAVAFLMADFLQISYAEVAIAAIVPSVLYYIALFVQTDLVASKRRIMAVPDDRIPRLVMVLARGWSFLLPFVVLIYALFWLGRDPETAALWACIAVAAIGFAFGYGADRLHPRKFWDCIVQTGVASSEILMIAAAAGLIMGILQLTGLGFALTMFLVSIGGGNIWLLLVIAAFLCILLGMGMPTLGVYVLLAVLIAPALVEVGITPLAAHMFILYLGMMSFVTPPIAIAAFFAATLAKAPPMRTGMVAMRFSWAAYIIPFLFVFSPSLLLQNPSVPETALALGTAVVAVWLVSAGIVGFGLRPMPLPSRLGAVLAGLLLLPPLGMADWAPAANVAGALLGALVLASEVIARRARPGRAPAAE